MSATHDSQLRAHAQSIRSRAILSALIAVIALCLTAAGASAGTDNYCNGCTEPNGQNTYEQGSYLLTYSYNHYTGTGSRWIGAGAVNIGSAAFAYNEVGHSYSGSYSSRAYDANASGHDLTGNAHSDF